MKSARFLLCLTAIGLADAAVAPWPAESTQEAVANTVQRLADLGGKRDMHLEMSAVHWNPVTKMLWLSAGGGSGQGTWVLGLDEAKQEFALLGSWDGPRDEGFTQVSYEPIAPGVHRAYLLEEGKPGLPGKIMEIDYAIGGEATTRRTWLLPETASQGKKGAEGLAFVPDAWLTKNGFVEKAGKPYTSSGGLGGVMVVAHQHFGRIHIYDLSADGSPKFDGRDTLLVGTFNSSHMESSGAEFDRSTGLLWISHNVAGNKLEVTDLTSKPVENQEGAVIGRKLTSLAVFDLPKLDNPEGFALAPQLEADGTPTKMTWAFIVNDREVEENEKEAAVLWFKAFKPGKIR